jgi:hypothetical protein
MTAVADGRTYAECALCGRAIASELSLCATCGPRHKGAISRAVWLFGPIGYLLIMTGWLGQRVWHWPRALSIAFAVFGVLVLSDVGRLFRLSRRMHRTRVSDRE